MFQACFALLVLSVKLHFAYTHCTINITTVTPLLSLILVLVDGPLLPILYFYYYYYYKQ